jgi:hypothetical protein
MGAKPVNGGLRTRRFGVEQAAVGPDSDKDPSLLRDPRRRVCVEGRIARIIHEQSIAGQMSRLMVTPRRRRHCWNFTQKAVYLSPSGYRARYSRHNCRRVTCLRLSSRSIHSKSGVG